MDKSDSSDNNCGVDNPEGKDFEIDDSEQKTEQRELKVVLPGDHIGEGFIAGHGTYENQKDIQIYASMAGVVHQID